MDIATHSASFTRKRATVEVNVDTIVERSFWRMWRRWFGSLDQTHPGEYLAEAAAFVCRAGGLSGLNGGRMTVRLRTDRRLTERPVRGDHYRGLVNIWVSPSTRRRIWTEPTFYTGRPLLPNYTVRNPIEALVACMAHETCHCLNIGRHPSKYWRSEQAMEGTEFVCELFAVAALEALCYPENERYQIL